MDELMIFTVFEVSAHLRQVIETQIDELYVRGEVSNFTHHSSGHMYFNLKDENATLRCTFFRNANHRLEFQIKDGLEVICLGKLTVFEKGGTYNLNVQSVSVSGQGDLGLRFEQLKQKLYEEGLFDQRYKKAFPRYPQRIGIVTSPTGAALQDISNILKRRFPVMVEVYPALVQGPDAPGQLIAGLSYFDSRDDIDLIIITRGGGSQEDLWCFNDEALARAVFACRHPVISAVGHEIDFSIADFVADLRAPTPSAAAEQAVPDRKELLGYLINVSVRMRLLAESKHDKASAVFADLRHNLLRFHPESRLQALQQRFDLLESEFEHKTDFLTLKRHQVALASKDLVLNGRNLSLLIREKLSNLQRNEQTRLQTLSGSWIDRARTILAQKSEVLRLNSPQEMLAKGYAYISRGNEHISSVEQVAPQDELLIHLKDGKLLTNVIECMKDRSD
mgnify:CR=1 FL=1